MKILVLIHEFPPIGGGGGPIARDLSRKWVKDGHQVRLVTARFADQSKREIVDGIDVIRLDSNRKESFRAKMPAMIGFILAASRYCLFQMKDFQPDIVHVHFAVPSGPIAYLYQIIKHVPYVMTAHLGDIPGASPEKTKKWFKFVFPFTPPIWKHAARVVAVSQYSRSMALNSYDLPIDVIPNGVEFQKIRNRQMERHSVPEIVFAGRFVKQKNLLLYIDVLNQIKDLNWHCTMIGDGEEREKIEQRIRSCGLDDRVSLPGWKKPDEVIEQFHHSDILFLPSLYEGLPVVGIQAMASGLALVLSDAGGNPEIVIPNVTGYTADPMDSDSYKRFLRQLLTNSDLLWKMRMANFEKAASFDIVQTASDYEKIFQSVLEN